MTTRHPPVIPEIAKAYQNDPKTLLAMAALKAGSSTAPVATGKYGIADGIARALQGAMGGYADRKQADAYGADQDQLLALRQQRGVDGLNGVAVPTPGVAPAATPMPPQAPAAAPAIASALGAPPPAPAPPQGAPGIPMAPLLPQGPPQGASAPPPGGDLLAAAQQGGGPGGQPPFGPSASAPAFLAQPTDAPVPNAPAPVARPVRPNAIGPTKSPMLNAAYRLMSDANPYESAQGQHMYQEGLGEQGKLNEAATARQQSITDAEYATDRGMYADASTQDRNAAIQERAATIARNAAGIVKYKDQLFEHGEEGLKLASAQKIAALERATQVQVANIKEAGDDRRAAASSSALTPEEQGAINTAVGDKRLDLMRVNTRNRKSMAQALIANPGLNAIQLSALATGQTAEGRTAGSRVGATDVATSEVPVLAAEAKMRHSQLRAQGNLVPLNKAVQMVQSGTSSPELARAVAVNGAVTNAYARSFGTGLVAVSAQKKAEEQLRNAWGTPAYEAALDQIVANTHMERQGAQAALSAIGGNNTSSPQKTGNPLVDKYLK